MVSRTEEPVKDVNVAELQGELTGLVDRLITVKGRLQRLLPTGECKSTGARQAMDDLVAVHGKLGALLHQLGVIEEPGKVSPALGGDPGPPVDEDKLLVVVCRNALLDAMSSFETLRPELASTGGPLQATHFRDLDPSIPERALEGIGRKIEKVLAELVRKATGKDIIIIAAEQGNKVDALLVQSAGIIKQRLGKPTVVVEIPAIDGLTEPVFRTLLTKVLSA